MLKSLFASFMSVIGLGAAELGSQATWLWWADEPKMPKSLIK